MSNTISKNSGMAALVLVLWTSLALAGLLFDVVEAYGSRLAAIKIEQKAQAARNAALLCRDMLLVVLSENAGFEPSIGPASAMQYKKQSCSIVSFSSSAATSGGEEKLVKIQGSYASSTAIFNIETKIKIDNELGEVPRTLYTKEISDAY